MIRFTHQIIPGGIIMDISIIIPVYNEAENIAPLSAEITEVLKALDRSYEIVFINGDDTIKTVHGQDKAPLYGQGSSAHAASCSPWNNRKIFPIR